MRTIRIGTLLAAVALAGACAAEGKEEPTNLPSAIADDADGKDDSLRKPYKAGTLRVNEETGGEFSATRGWIAYEVELEAGKVDVALWGTDDWHGGDLDTVVYVFGPKRANGTYPTALLAWNDDAEPGWDVSSRVRVNVASTGTYRVVVSTYDNYWYYPTNVSRGVYRVIVKCPAGGEACGPAAVPVGGACWADAECVAGAHCEGEIVCEPGTACLWTRQGTCVEDYVWLAIEPKQCASNPWNVTTPGDGETPSYPISELAYVDNYFESRGIDLLEVGLVWPAEPLFTCSACSCPRGDRLVVKARGVDAPRLVSEFGFTALGAGAWLGTGPKQCGSNPWNAGAPAGSPKAEAAKVVSWAAGASMPVAEAGFVYRTESFITCAACSCPRGDTLLVRPASTSASNALSTHGFGDIYVP